MSTIIARGLPRKRRIGPPVEQLFSDAVRLCTVTPTGTPGHFKAEVNGKLVVESSPQPFLDAARALLASGADSNATLILRHAGSDTNSLIAKVGIAARLTVREDGGESPRFASWKAWPPSRAVAPPVRSNRSSLPMAASPGLAP